jgi:hypothetical protein
MIRFGSSLGALVAASMVALLSPTAMAAPTVVSVDEYQVIRGGLTIFDDSFASNTALVGGAGAFQTASVPFSNPSATADYFVHGTIL